MNIMLFNQTPAWIGLHILAKLVSVVVCLIKIKKREKGPSVEAQGKIPKVLVLADIERCQAHGISLDLSHNSSEEFGLFAAGGVDLLVERIAEGHQLVDLGDDAVLFLK